MGWPLRSLGILARTPELRNASTRCSLTGQKAHVQTIVASPKALTCYGRKRSNTATRENSSLLAQPAHTCSPAPCFLWRTGTSETGWEREIHEASGNWRRVGKRDETLFSQATAAVVSQLDRHGSISRLNPHGHTVTVHRATAMGEEPTFTVPFYALPCVPFLRNFSLGELLNVPLRRISPPLPLHSC